MIGHSQAYIALKQSMQKQLDFVALVCHAVPVLNRAIAVYGGPSSPVPLGPPDHFTQRRLSAPQLSSFSQEYQDDLARTLILSSFSYFEAYVRAVIKEFLEFQGGAEAYQTLALKRSRKSLGTLPDDLLIAKRKLQEANTKGKDEKYVKNAKVLVEAGFRFPSELFSTYGLSRLAAKVGKDKRQEMKAFEIPDILGEAFHWNTMLLARTRFDAIRKIRNDIAHGQRKKVTLKEAIQVGRELREWSTALDKHLCEHFFVMETYAP